MNKAGKLYIQHVGLLLDCTLGRKRDAMADVRHIVELYLEDNPNASYEDITKELGDPEHMTEELMMDIPVADILPFEKALFEYVDTRYPEIPESIRTEKVINEEIEQKLIAAIGECKKEFMK